MRAHWIWYTLLPNITNKQKLALLSHFSDPEEIFHQSEATLSQIEGMDAAAVKALMNRDMTKAQKILNICGEKDIGILPFNSEQYPPLLRNIVDPPLVLYYRGILPDFAAQPVVGMVGTRKASIYGLNVARNFGYEIALCGGLVVSGAADGIDAAAMEGALIAEAPTVGVLGCGVDVVYPKCNRALFEKTVKSGCLLSEYLPGTKPYRWNFPERNRIISGMSNCVLVAEAPEDSGALITAEHAFTQGREVFAVPGNVGTKTCAGSNALLQDRATAAVSGWAVLSNYATMFPGKVVKRDAPTFEFTEEKVAQSPRLPDKNEIATPKADKKDVDNAGGNPYIGIENLSEEEKAVIAHLTAEPCSVDVVAECAGLPTAKVLSILTILAIKGVVKNHPGNRVSLKS